MNDAKTGKTLTLKKKVDPSTPADGERRKRAGGRARQVAQIERQREQQRNVQAPAAVVTSRANMEKPAPSRKRHPTESIPEAGTPQPQPTQEHAREKPRRGLSRSHGSARAEIFPVFTPCPQGLEEALVAELQALGFDDAEPARAGCRFHTDWTGILRANLYSRLATRVLVQVAHGPAYHEDDILDLAMDTPWERWFGAEQTLRVDTSAIRSPMQSLQYCNLRVKDGICDRLREHEGARPDIDTVRPDARVHLFLDEDSATLYLDTSGESLFKRGWRLAKGEAPLRENLAAGILALSGWDPAEALMDPFCGSGTILIEAAWIALGVPPGIWRPFGFERLRNHDARHWRDIKDEARSHIATRLESPIVGYDLDPAAIDAAKANLERSWLTPDSIRFEVGDAKLVPPAADIGWLVTNPPYGERLPSEEDTGLWRAWAQNLKQNYSGWNVSIISSDMDLPRALRLKPLRRYPLYNGSLDCRLFSFEMVEAGYRNK
ncbi:class I SAM-dependent RNA methyltransferase [Candidimonas sp. SYP-B2681]|uniref:THUMP domain-containing class I SAM-dependent RNA methyltransferase n=1 Tax=Candidimonas sp. SYP-B2681 TaxID=2497686 RepID=UPI000F8777FA|nr:THUMP domain-containing protein [Candidimonas sp. SYP-B2681]RTZ42534.1 class I SAM-dependent RNA methyltransferase [Candidimonas sp. SYP-B2681]